jgi:U3 small nucleolar ribonucleoprotein protein IMP4
MSRREIRLRKEFLYKKQIESTQLVRNEKKRKLRTAIDGNKAIPTEMVNEARDLHHEMELDIDAVQAIDDEYANVGVREPKVCVTTSRDPSSRLKQFSKSVNSFSYYLFHVMFLCREIKICVPNSQSINRGTFRIDEIMEACKKADFTDVIFVNETRGQPDGLIISHLPFGPTAYFTLTNCVLRHDIPECTPSSQAYPHLILDGFESKIGQRIFKIIQALYPIPRPESHRILTFANRNDFVSFRHHMYTKDKGKVAIKEAGPRFEMQPYEVSYY